METSVVIVAAGKGKRMKAGKNKIWLHLQHKPIFQHTVEAFIQHPGISEVVLVINEQDYEDMDRWRKSMPYSVILAIGGAERQDSVRNGLEALSESCTHVLIHDAARPFITGEQISGIITKLKDHQAVVVAVPVKDTIKIVGPDGIVQATPARESLWAVQTPQAFPLSLVKEAHQFALEQGKVGTDDAMLVEMLGYPVTIVDGSYENIKVTTPDDLWFGEEIMKRRSEERKRRK
ncbi:2-C-methyl-D-erythritol 4-phosphate cytidylyltransferase [Brevibacillus laterosporus]|uniref:2-C-methyl-D-erythritol 4-phosphate cytidylyltransferase n=1 Tax=Brevibacillus laterosporus TaxID=1465 RepID=UPI002653284D|nr:2-C-methyl-D-erythritol 4-phosphate cytidylyltransferase [Brevibacillus laterosporus]MDN9012265.1 2-C-methyl-D-erythritol 4-phosphate cytidylyltransferase [Brevibacillus laterosporus]MDO0943361.1 2-C-methyl-D-erythritol 4-phosphate cytidylyltransferase [Brevibacillus laterosporus]